jgi:hypothetical protein
MTPLAYFWPGATMQIQNFAPGEMAANRAMIKNKENKCGQDARALAGQSAAGAAMIAARF